MNADAKQKTRDLGPAMARILYAGFVLIAVYHAFRSSLGDSFSSMAIAMIFDPFDQSVSFRDRPLYQKIWLFVHVGIVIILGILAFTKTS